MKKNIIIWGIVIIVVVGVGAFFGGLAIGKSSSVGALRSRAAAFGNGTGAFAARGGQGSGVGVLSGSVLSLSAQSLTLQDRSGSSHVVFYSTSTDISKPTAVPASDIQTGDSVTVMGTANPDGSFTAQSIDIRPSGPAGAPSQAPMIPAPAPTAGQ